MVTPRLRPLPHHPLKELQQYVRLGWTGFCVGKIFVHVSNNKSATRPPRPHQRLRLLHRLLPLIHPPPPRQQHAKLQNSASTTKNTATSLIPLSYQPTPSPRHPQNSQWSSTSCRLHPRRMILQSHLPYHTPRRHHVRNPRAGNFVAMGGLTRRNPLGAASSTSLLPRLHPFPLSQLTPTPL